MSKPDAREGKWGGDGERSMNQAERVANTKVQTWQRG